MKEKIYTKINYSYYVETKYIRLHSATKPIYSHRKKKAYELLFILVTRIHKKRDIKVELTPHSISKLYQFPLIIVIAKILSIRLCFIISNIPFFHIRSLQQSSVSTHKSPAFEHFTSL